MIFSKKPPKFKNLGSLPKVKTQGLGPWKRQYFSFCSKHFSPKDNCIGCQSGIWVNVWKHHFGSFLFQYFPKIWVWWSNK